MLPSGEEKQWWWTFSEERTALKCGLGTLLLPKAGSGPDAAQCGRNTKIALQKGARHKTYCSPSGRRHCSLSESVRINRWNSLPLLAIETGQTSVFISKILNQVSAGRRAYSNAIAGSTGSTGSTGSSTHWRSAVRRRFTGESLVQGSNLDIT
jgi:hypothetical protein